MTAEKARIFLLKVKDGHGLKEPIYAAANSTAELNNDLKRNCYIPSNEKLDSIDHLKFKNVEVGPDIHNEFVEFTVKINEKDVRFGPNSIGYNYLTQQFPQKVKSVEDFLSSLGDEP